MRKAFWRGVGRIASSRGSANKRRKILEYLAIVAVKHKIDANEFLNCIVEAWNQEKAKCKQLVIRCRGKKRDTAVFLFTAGRVVLAQFPIPTEILQGKNELEGYMDMVHIKAAPVEEVANPRIKDLKTGMKGVSLKVRVIEIPEPNKVYTRHGTEAYVTNALVGDETGTTRMNLRNQQINMVSESNLIKIENGTVANFRGEGQLGIGKHGRITVVQDAERLSS